MRPGRTSRGRLRGLVIGLFLLTGPACEYQGGPEDPSPVVPPGFVSVTIEYRQPNGCVNSANRCTDPVVFFGSWMVPGQEITMTAPNGGLIWVGTAHNVPVNYPARDFAHAVRVFDPHILDHPTGGVTAERLRVGRQLMTVFDSAGTPAESGLVYVDANGFGHSPF
jgi:hypothetical protein